MSEISITGQKKLLSSSVLIVGCGGLASTVIPNLAAAGVGRLVLYDSDTIALTNLNRQTLYTPKELGELKVKNAAKFVTALNPEIKIEWHNKKIAPSNFESCFKDVDIVIDCTDSIITKFFLNDACIESNIHLVHCAATGFKGQILTIPRGGRPCLRCIFEQLPDPGSIPTCQSTGIIGSICAVAGGIATTEVIKILLDLQNNSMVGKLQKFDLKHNLFNYFNFFPNPDCRICSENANIDPTDLNEYKIRMNYGVC